MVLLPTYDFDKINGVYYRSLLLSKKKTTEQNTSVSKNKKKHNLKNTVGINI